MFPTIKAALIGKLSRDLEHDSPTSKRPKEQTSKIKPSPRIGLNAERLGSCAARIISSRSAHQENFRLQILSIACRLILAPCRQRSIWNFQVTTRSRGLRQKTFNASSRSFGMQSLRI